MVTPTFRALRRYAIAIFAVWIGTTAVAHAADITARTDRAEIGTQESFTLTFEAEGSVDGDPDFEPLTENFDIINTTQSSRVNIVNGEITRRKTWTLQLFPKHEGEITIPAIAFGNDRSPELQINVSQSASTDNPGTDKDIFLKVEAEPQNPYVQQQVLYTIRLYRRVATNNARLTDPEIPDADVVLKQLDRDRQYETVVDGRRYQVYERRYVIFPQQSGSLRIEPINFAAVVSSRGDPFGFGFGGGGRQVRRQSEAVTLQVRPAPDAFTGRHWLPAESLQLSQGWSPDPPVFKVGEPVTRNLTLAAEGLTAAQLPRLNIEVPADMKQYPDQPELTDDAGGGAVLGRRVEKTALIPTRPGEYTLPAVELPWWNTKTGRMETARIPARAITVAAAPGSQPPSSKPSTAGPQTDETGQTAPADTPAAGEPTTRQTSGAESGLWPWLSALLAAGWLITLGLWGRREIRSRRNHHRQTSVSDHALNARRALNRLEKACREHDAEAAKAALIDWARAQRPGESIHNLSAVARPLDDAAAEQVQALNSYLYRGKTGEWDGDSLWQAVKECKAVKEGKRDSSGDALEPLHKI